MQHFARLQNRISLSQRVIRTEGVSFGQPSQQNVEKFDELFMEPKNVGAFRPLDRDN